MENDGTLIDSAIELLMEPKTETVFALCQRQVHHEIQKIPENAEYSSRAEQRKIKRTGSLL